MKQGRFQVDFFFVSGLGRKKKEHQRQKEQIIRRMIYNVYKLRYLHLNLLKRIPIAIYQITDRLDIPYQ